MTTTWNASDLQTITLSGGNLVATSTGVHGAVRSVDRVTSGKYYWEYTCTTFAQSNSSVGIATPDAPFNNITVNAQLCCLAYKSTGNIWLNGAAAGPSIGAIAAGAVVCCALDMDNGFFWIRNGAAGNWNGNAANNPATPSGGLNIRGMGTFPTFYALGAPLTSDVVTANFGASAFAGTVPTGFTSGFPSGTSAANTIAVGSTERETLEGDSAATVYFSGLVNESLINSATAVVAGIVQEVLSNTQTVYAAGMVEETLAAGSYVWAAGIAQEVLTTMIVAVVGGQVAVTINTG